MSHLFKYDPIVYAALGQPYYDWTQRQVLLYQLEEQKIPTFVRKVLGQTLIALVGRNRYWRYQKSFRQLYPSKRAKLKAKGDLSSLRKYFYSTGVLKNKSIIALVKILTGKHFNMIDPNPVAVNELVRFAYKSLKIAPQSEAGFLGHEEVFKVIKRKKLSERKYELNVQLNRIYDSFSALNILQGMGILEVDRPLFYYSMMVNTDHGNLQLAKFSDWARAKLFKVKVPSVIIPYLKLKHLNLENLARLSFLKRAIPPPIKVNDQFTEYLKAQRRKLYVPTDDFKGWAKDWSKSLWKPEYETYNYTISTSVNACIERPRKAGGVLSMFGPIAQYQLSRLFAYDTFDKYQRKFDKHLVKELSKILNKVFLYKVKKAKEVLNALGEVFSRTEEDSSIECFLYTKLLYYGSLNLLRIFQNTGILLCPVTIRERGFKIRIATKSNSFVVILAKVLRSTVDWILKADPRIKTGISDDPYSRPLQFKPEDNEAYRSVDLTTASDNHSFGFTRAFYKAVWKGSGQRLPYKAKWILKILTSHHVLIRQKNLIASGMQEQVRSYSPINPFQAMVDLKPDLYRGISVPSFGRDVQVKYVDENYGLGYEPDRVLKPERTHHTAREILTSIYVTETSARLAVDCFEKPFRKTWKKWVNPTTDHTRRGQPMGLSIAWPCLSALNLYSYERAITKGEIPEGRPFVPKGANRISTLGDDAEMPIRKKQSELFTGIVQEMGGVVSKTKDYYHPHLALFAEMIFGNKPMNAGSISNMTGVRGGARNAHWASSYESVKMTQKLRRYNYEEFWKYSPFFKEWEYASKELPIDAPLAAGGLGIPFFKKKDDYRHYVANIPPLDWNLKPQFSILTEPDLNSKISGFSLPKYLEEFKISPSDNGELDFNQVREFVQTPHNLCALFEQSIIWEEVKRPNILGTIHRYKRFVRREFLSLPTSLDWDQIVQSHDLKFRPSDIRLQFTLDSDQSVKHRKDAIPSGMVLRSEKYSNMRSILIANTLGEYSLHPKYKAIIPLRGHQKDVSRPSSMGKYLQD